MAERLPKLIVFDLDYTLWPFWVDTDVDPPFHRNDLGVVKDRSGQTVSTYKGVEEVLQTLHGRFTLAVASRTPEPAWARQLLAELDLMKFFSHFEIYPDSKLQHFAQFKTVSGIEYRDMLFFDDEQRNINEISRLGVTCVLVKEGVNRSVVSYGMDEFKRKLVHSQ